MKGSCVVRAPRRERRGRGAAAAAAGLAALLATAGGCASPRAIERTLDESNAAITRGICDLVDATDRVFGEPRVEDRERIVRLALGPELELRENAGSDLRVPVSLRAPLPALERRANIFLQLETRADSLAEGREAAATFEEHSSLTATILTRVADLIDTGARLDLFWNGGAHTGVRPFARWERSWDATRALIEQQGYLNSDVGFGARTIAQLDRVIDTGSFLRFRVSFEGNEELEGLGVEQALIYRRPSPLWNAALSLELGAASNRFDGDPATGEAGPEADPDESFLRARVTGRMWRRWIQYELAPALHHPWRHEDPWEWSVTLSLRFLYEDYLRSPRAAAPEPFPGADPGPP